MTTVKFQGSGVGAVAAKGVEHLPGEFGEHGGVVLAVYQETGAANSHAAFNVRHGADGSPVFSKLVDGHVMAKTLPDVVGGHTLTDDVSVVSGDVEEAAGADGGVVDQGDGTDRGAQAGTKDAEFGVALLLKPAEAAAGVADGLAVGLEGEANIGAADLVGALVALGHAAVVIGHAHFKGGDAETLNPVAEAVLALPLSVPVRENKDGGTGTGAWVRTRNDGPSGREELSVNDVVFGPRGFDGAGEGQDVFRIEAVVGGGGGGEPVVAGRDGILGILADEGAGIGMVG